jgi:hypothetical protein
MVIRNEHVPKGAPFDPVLIRTIRTVMQFEDLGDGRTRVTESGVGYGEAPATTRCMRFSATGTPKNSRHLAQSFVTGPVDWKAEAAKMEASVHKPVAPAAEGAKP